MGEAQICADNGGESLISIFEDGLNPFKSIMKKKVGLFLDVFGLSLSGVLDGL